MITNGFKINHIRKIPNPRYPTEKELNELNAYYKKMLDEKKIVIGQVPDSIQSIITRKAQEPDSVWAVIKTGITKDDFVSVNGNKQYQHFEDALQVVYHKVPFVLKGGKIIPGKQSTDESSFLLIYGKTFEFFSDGSYADPGNLIIEGFQTKQKMGLMLPSDYVTGE